MQEAKKKEKVDQQSTRRKEKKHKISFRYNKFLKQCHDVVGRGTSSVVSF